VKDYSLNIMTDWFAPLAGLLVPRDPRQFLSELLTTARTIADARGIAAFARAQGELKLALSIELDQSTLDAASLLWARHREALASGETVPVVVGSGVAHGLPVRSGDHLVGLLVATTAGPLTPEAAKSLAGLATLAASALQAPDPAVSPVPAQIPAAPQSAIAAYLGRTPAEDVLRDQMLGLLTANEWNIARVARLLGITRRTVYQRLERWGLERVKIRVTDRRRKVPASS
jgi:hypothetical protein